MRTALVLNISTGIRVNRVFASEAVEACAAVWVEAGKSIRKATEEESIAMRNQQAARKQRRAPFLCYVEIRGVIFRPTARNAESHRRERSYAKLTSRVEGGDRYAQFVRLSK